MSISLVTSILLNLQFFVNMSFTYFLMTKGVILSKFLKELDTKDHSLMASEKWRIFRISVAIFKIVLKLKMLFISKTITDGAISCKFWMPLVLRTTYLKIEKKHLVSCHRCILGLVDVLCHGIFSWP